MKKVILDVDTGIDDAIGILLAEKSGLADILGITVVNGNTSLAQGTRNTRKVARLLGREDWKVVQGAARPLLREPYFEVSVHGQDGIGGALSEMDVTIRDEGFAPDFIIEQAEQYPGELTVIALAPLTNLALAIRKEPRLNGWLKEIVIMGGAFEHRGNITPTAEYNMFIDPEAAKIVLDSGIPMTMVGLDVSSDTLLTEQDIQSIKPGPVRDFVETATVQYMDHYERSTGSRACAMHDPLAVAVALDRTLAKTEARYVDVETNSDLCDGKTVCDFAGSMGKEPNVQVCTEVDRKRFIGMLIDTLGK